MRDNLKELVRLLETLSDRQVEMVAGYAAFLQWQEREKNARAEAETAQAIWAFDFVENFKEASGYASGDEAGMEIRVGRAVCGGEEKPAVFAHPPLRGDAVVQYLVPVPAGVESVRLRFAVGIRDGSQIAEDNLVSFRVLVNNGRVWGTQTNALRWEEHEIPLPLTPGDIGRVSFVTESLVDHQWNWAVWGSPLLVGYSAPR